MQFHETIPEDQVLRSSTGSQSSQTSRKPVASPQASPNPVLLAQSTLKLQNTPQPPQNMAGGLKKSKSVRAKNALKTIANPIKTRREEKAKRNNQEMKEKEEAEKNVQDFLATGRYVLF